MGSSKDDLLNLLCKVQREVGYALYLAQLGLESTNGTFINKKQLTCFYVAKWS
jgi:phage-related protein